MTDLMDIPTFLKGCSETLPDCMMPDGADPSRAYKSKRLRTVVAK